MFHPSGDFISLSRLISYLSWTTPSQPYRHYEPIPPIPKCLTGQRMGFSPTAMLCSAIISSMCWADGLEDELEEGHGYIKYMEGVREYGAAGYKGTTHLSCLHHLCTHPRYIDRSVHFLLIRHLLDILDQPFFSLSSIYNNINPTLFSQCNTLTSRMYTYDNKSHRLRKLAP